MSLEHSVVPKNKNVLKIFLKGRVMSKGHRSQPERTLNAKAKII